MIVNDEDSYGHAYSIFHRGFYDVEMPGMDGVTATARLLAAFTANLVAYNRGANQTTFAQTGLPRGATYYCRIMAQNNFGQSVWVNVTPFPIITP